MQTDSYVSRVARHVGVPSAGSARGSVSGPLIGQLMSCGIRGIGAEAHRIAWTNRGRAGADGAWDDGLRRRWGRRGRRRRCRRRRELAAMSNVQRQAGSDLKTIQDFAARDVDACGAAGGQAEARTNPRQTAGIDTEAKIFAGLVLDAASVVALDALIGVEAPKPGARRHCLAPFDCILAQHV